MKLLTMATLLISVNSTIASDSDLFNKYANETYRKLDNSITYHLIKSPYGINWDNKARNVVLNLALNKYVFPDTKRSIGHVTVELNCSSELGKRRVITGQGAKSLDQLSSALVKGGVGLSLVNRPSSYPNLPLVTTEGRLEDEKVLLPEFNLYLREYKGTRTVRKVREHTNKMAFLTYKISEVQCQQMLDFYNEYKMVTEQTKNTETPLAGNVYGFGADPILMQGAGCATYAEAFFLSAGLEKEFNFYRNVYASPLLVGDPNNGHSVSLSNLLFSSEKIGIPGKDKLHFKFPDPDMMHDFVQEINMSSKKFKKVESYGAFGKKSKYAIIDLTSQ